ncbi:MAG TPA: glutaredoxin domain-containing protein [Acidimicrobiales bacterium]|nr:glutaredoxin domain-containing protein [Acidimicrobiales bacterium]
MDEAHGEVTVYWRPGCMFCSSLRLRLDRAGVPHRLVNIWDDPDGAAFVRSVARGNETVPTVAVGEVALVNPSLHEVLAVASRHAPDAVPAGYQPPQPGRVSRWIARALGG